MITETISVLGQNHPNPNTLTTLFTANKATSCSSIIICNTSDFDDVFRVAVSVAGAADTLKQYIYYDYPVLANTTIYVKIGITLSSSDLIRTYSSSGLLSFSLFGVEYGLASTGKLLFTSATAINLGDLAWANASDALTLNSQYSHTDGQLMSGQTSNKLLVYDAPLNGAGGLSVSNIIDSVVVRVRLHQEAAGMGTIETGAWLYIDGVDTSVNKATNTLLPASDSYFTYTFFPSEYTGGLTVDQVIQVGNFGFAFTVESNADNSDAFVDVIDIEIFFH